MALVNVRDYAYNANTRTWQGTGTGVWACNPASWPRISAFVVRRPRGGVPSLASIAAETAILMQNVRWQRPVAGRAPYLMWTPGFHSFPSHLSRFLTESMGLCIAVESARSYGWTPSMPLLDADRLGSHSPFNVPGVRPDFIAQTPNGWRGIEARGRSSGQPVTNKRPVAAQTGKLTGLGGWATRVGANLRPPINPAWSMSWAWITDTGTNVDHFDPGEPFTLGPQIVREIDESISVTAAHLLQNDDSAVQRVQAFRQDVATYTRRIDFMDSQAEQVWLTIAVLREPISIEAARDWSREHQILDRAQQFLGEYRNDIIYTDFGTQLAVAIAVRPFAEEYLPTVLSVTVGTRDPLG